MRLRAALAVTLFLAVLNFARAGEGAGYPDRGTNAPPFKQITWLNTPTRDGVELRDKVVVLEFWASWCDACRLALPHVNDLARRFNGDSVVFILLSDESPQVVAQFLEANSVLPAVGCDTSGETFEIYDIRRIPRTFLIDKFGVVAWYGHPNSITGDVLTRYLKSGDVPPIAFEADSMRIPELVQRSEPGFSLAVNHAQSGERSGRQTGTSIIEREEGRVYEIEFKGRQLSEIISRLSGEPLTRIRFNPALEFEPIYDLSLEISPPMDFEPGRSKAIQTLCDALHLKIQNRESPTAGMTMTISAPGFLVPAAAPGSNNQLEGSIWTGNGITLGQLAEHLESQLGVIIWNDTSMDGEYDFVIPISSVDTARKALQSSYGLTLDPTTRPVSLLLIERVKF